MPISAKVIKDSISPGGVRLTTFQVQMPKFILAEFNTHGMLSRNAASSRAIPMKTMLEKIAANHFVPRYLGKNQKGMAAQEELSPQAQEKALAIWNEHRDFSERCVRQLNEIGLHKQHSNRLLEAHMFVDDIVTATDWDNLYSLRTAADAQPEFRELAEAMLVAHNASRPTRLKPGQWHLPYVEKEEIQELGMFRAIRCSAARCCRVSYWKHDKSNPDPLEDESLHDDLVKNGHMSPLEHQATPGKDPGLYNGKLRGWICYRKTIPGENRSSFAGLLPPNPIETED